jgi:8-oxo-dGTP pyrophosphatase MutT (NUDIX family)
MKEPCVHGVAVVVVRDGRFLMIRRAPTIRAGGAWCFVGGAMEPGESQAEAVAREFREEVGGWVRPLEKLWEFRSADGKLHLHWWLAELVDDCLRPNPAEVTELGWLTSEEIRCLSNVLESNLRFLGEIGEGLGRPARSPPS